MGNMIMIPQPKLQMLEEKAKAYDELLKLLGEQEKLPPEIEKKIKIKKENK